MGKRSGAHFNPAITLTYLRLGKIDRPDAGFYVLFQFIGAVAGGRGGGFDFGRLHRQAGGNVRRNGAWSVRNGSCICRRDLYGGAANVRRALVFESPIAGAAHQLFRGNSDHVSMCFCSRRYPDSASTRPARPDLQPSPISGPRSGSTSPRRCSACSLPPRLTCACTGSTGFSAPSFTRIRITIARFYAVSRAIAGVRQYPCDRARILRPEQYREFERTAQVRSEYIGGEMFAMSGGTVNQAGYP